MRRTSSTALRSPPSTWRHCIGQRGRRCPLEVSFQRWAAGAGPGADLVGADRRVTAQSQNVANARLARIAKDAAQVNLSKRWGLIAGGGAGAGARAPERRGEAGAATNHGQMARQVEEDVHSELPLDGGPDFEPELFILWRGVTLGGAPLGRRRRRQSPCLEG